jgi:predicted small secreted protein
VLNRHPYPADDRDERRHYMKRLILIVLALITLSILAGCATFRGIGEDLEEVGRWMQQ